MPVFTPSVDIWLLRSEQTLRQTLDSGDIPFLGLYSDLFAASWRDTLRKSLRSHKEPLRIYLQGLNRWPAIFAAYLTIHVVEGFGENGDAAVYPFVSKAIFGAERDLSQMERAILWQEYRRACIILGLDVVPLNSAPNYMVAEYLHQAGVPVNFLPRIAKRMLRHAAVAGVPERDDPQGIALWQTTLIDRLGPPIPVTATKAIQADRGGFYARLFLRALAGEPADPTAPDRSIYESIVEVIASKDSDRKRILTQRLTIPKVVLRDDLLGVELPAGTEVSWRIAVVDGIGCKHEGTGEPRFVPFDFPPLPGSVHIARSDGKWSKEFGLWDDGRNNRFLAFDSTGLLAGSSRLNAEESLQVEPGKQTLMTRFRPDGYETELVEVSQNPSLYRLVLDLAPGESVTLKRGSAQTTILALSHPILTLCGEIFRGIGGNELYASGGLVLRGQVPTELLASTSVDSGSLLAGLSAPGLNDPVEFAFVPDSTGTFEINLDEICRLWKPGLARLSVELRRTGLRRSIARIAVWLWNGLDRIGDRVRFTCTHLPGNLSREASDNLAIDDTAKTITYRSDAKRYFHLVFDLPENRSVRFVGAVPGAFMMLVRFQEEEGQVLEQPLRHGTVLAVREGSREVLDVFSSQGGALTLGTMRQEISPRSGLKRLHLSALAQYLEPGINRLCIEFPNSTPLPLLQLVTPHRVLKMDSQLEAGTLRVWLDLPAAAEMMRCTAIDVLTGGEIHLDVACNDAPARLDRQVLAWLACGERQSDGCYRHALEFPLERWRCGAWVLHLEARLNARWGSLVNEREDVYAWGFVLDESCAPASRPWLSQRLNDGDSLNTVGIFKRVHCALLPCYAPDAWPGLDWLARAWRQLTRRLHACDAQVLTELIALDAMGPPETGQQSWFPLLSPGGSMPWIYACAATAYRGVERRAGVIGELKRIRPPLCGLFLDHRIERTAAAGFENFMEMQRGAPPRNFSLARYRQAMAARNTDDVWSLLSREDWRPSEGDYLGPVHWRFAFGSMQGRYRRTLLGNEARRGWALQLLRSTEHLTLADIAMGLPKHLNGRDGLGRLDPTPADGWSQEDLNLLCIDRLLCLFAAVCRWEVREAGALTTWCQAVENIDLPDANARELALGYLLYIGRDVFEFYLLLWELIFAADTDAA